jgi:hypothetical protein
MNRRWLTLAAAGMLVLCLSAGALFAQQPARNPLGAADVPPTNPLGRPELDLPTFLRPGLRISYSGGSSTVHNVSKRLEKDPDANWVDPTTGQRYNEKDARNSGGVGYTQLDVLHAEPAFVAMDAKHHLLVDVTRNVSKLSGTAAVVGNAAAAGDYWIHPRRLAEMPVGTRPGLSVSRQKYVLNDATLNAVSIVTTSENSYASKIYDLSTGLLLSLSTSDVGDDVTGFWRQQQFGKAKGAANIGHLRLIGTRPVTVPWANDPPPAWATKGRKLSYAGGYNLVTPSGALPPLPADLVTTFEDVSHGCVIAGQVMRTGIGQNLPPNVVTSGRIFGPASAPGAWLAPKAAGQMRPGQVIDEDPVTRTRLSFGGVQGNAAVLIEQGPAETRTFAYDAQTGVLSGVKVVQPQAAGGEVHTELRLTGQE